MLRRQHGGLGGGCTPVGLARGREVVHLVVQDDACKPRTGTLPSRHPHAFQLPGMRSKEGDMKPLF